MSTELFQFQHINILNSLPFPRTMHSLHHNFALHTQICRLSLCAQHVAFFFFFWLAITTSVSIFMHMLVFSSEWQCCYFHSFHSFTLTPTLYRNACMLCAPNRLVHVKVWVTIVYAYKCNWNAPCWIEIIVCTALSIPPANFLTIQSIICWKILVSKQLSINFIVEHFFRNWNGSAIKWSYKIETVQLAIEFPQGIVH